MGCRAEIRQAGERRSLYPSKSSSRRGLLCAMRGIVILNAITASRSMCGALGAPRACPLLRSAAIYAMSPLPMIIVSGRWRIGRPITSARTPALSTTSSNELALRKPPSLSIAGAALLRAALRHRLFCLSFFTRGRRWRLPSPSNEGPTAR